MGDTDIPMTSTVTVSSGKKPQVDTGRRRSSFAPGRKSLLDVAQKEELCRQIPCDFPAAHRLSQLVRLALQQTFRELETEMGDVPGFEFFRAEGMKSMETVVDTMEADGIFEKACENAGTAPNPINLQMDDTVTELTGSISRLEKESEGWDTLLQQLEGQAREAESQLSQLEVDSEELPGDVQEMAQAYLADVPDVSSIVTDVSNDVKTISLLMDQYQDSVNLLSQAHQLAKQLSTHAAKTLDRNTNGFVDSPRKTIEKMTSNAKP